MNKTWYDPNLYLGVLVHDQQSADERIPILLDTPAAKRFVLYEPAGPCDFNSYLSCNRCFGKGWFYKHISDCFDKYAEKQRCEYCEKRALSIGIRPGFDEYVTHTCKGLNWIIMQDETCPNPRPMRLDWASSVRDQCEEAGVPFWFDRELDGVIHEGRPE
jgi:protein gp37